MKKIRFCMFILIIGSLTFAVTAFAQTEVLTLKLSRDYGYGGLNDDIQGLFSMKVSGLTDLVKVVFYIDSTAIGQETQPPYNFQFNTDSYGLGQHTLYAVGYSSNGQEYKSNSVICNFVSASVGNRAALRIVVPILLIIFGAIFLSFAVPLIIGRGKLKSLPFGAERNYGTSGGICPKCHRPFALPLFSMNLGFSKLARCPYCGKWSIVRIQSISKLREAERAEMNWGKGEVLDETEEEKIRNEIEESKYQ
jgi:hypothetical protein